MEQLRVEGGVVIMSGLQVVKCHVTAIARKGRWIFPTGADLTMTRNM